MSGIFISYRRTDTQPDARQLARQLSERFGSRRVFRDVEDIPKGYSFAQVIQETLARYNVVLVLIGERWLDAANEDGRRLDDPEDTLRQEVAQALRGDRLVIPVLLGKTEMPKAGDLPEELRKLAELNAHRIAEDHYDVDVAALIAEIEKHVRPRLRVPAWEVSIAVVIVLALLAWQFVPGLPPTPWEATPTHTPTSTATPTAMPTHVQTSAPTASGVPTKVASPPTAVPTPTPLPPTPTPTDAPTEVPTPTSPPTDTPTPVPTPGLVLRQAVTYDSTLVGRGDASDHEWVPASTDAASGCPGEDTFAMQSRKRPPDPPLTGSQDAMYELNGPALVYEVDLLPGTYSLYLRASAETTDQDAVFVSWQPQGKTFSTRLTGEKGLKFKAPEEGAPPELSWQPGQGDYLGQTPIEVVVESAGRQTFIVQMRKTGLVLKSILLSPNPCDFTAHPCDVERACGVAP